MAPWPLDVREVAVWQLAGDDPGIVSAAGTDALPRESQYLQGVRAS